MRKKKNIADPFGDAKYDLKSRQAIVNIGLMLLSLLSQAFTWSIGRILLRGILFLGVVPSIHDGLLKP